MPVLVHVALGSVEPAEMRLLEEDDVNQLEIKTSRQDTPLRDESYLLLLWLMRKYCPLYESAVLHTQTLIRDKGSFLEPFGTFRNLLVPNLVEARTPCLPCVTDVTR